MRRKRNSKNRIFAVLGFVLLVIIIMDFNSRMTHLTALKYEQVGEQQRLDSLTATETTLKEELFSVSSDDAVEEWARTYEKLAREGDFPIVIIPSGETINGDTVKEILDAQTFSNFDNWMRWLFGSEQANLSP